MSGAIEGFLTAFDEHDVAKEVDRSLQAAGGVVRSATSEAKAQAATPEMKDLAGDLKAAGSVVGEKVHSAADATKEAARNASEAVHASAHDAASTVQSATEALRDRVDHLREEVKVRADAVGETAHRARHAPAKIGAHLRDAYRAWMRGLVTAIVMAAVMAIFSILTLIVLTIALVVGLNQLVGDPAGTWIVAGAYLAVTTSAYFVMRARRAAAAEETRRHMERSRDEVRHVAAPVRSAFSGGGRAGF